jgi:hypothetical protein
MRVDTERRGYGRLHALRTGRRVVGWRGHHASVCPSARGQGPLRRFRWNWGLITRIDIGQIVAPARVSRLREGHPAPVAVADSRGGNLLRSHSWTGVDVRHGIYTYRYRNRDEGLAGPTGVQAGQGGRGRALSRRGPAARRAGAADDGMVRCALRPLGVRHLRRLRRRAGARGTPARCRRRRAAQRADELFAEAPRVERLDVLADKLPSRTPASPEPFRASSRSTRFPCWAPFPTWTRTTCSRPRSVTEDEPQLPVGTRGAMSRPGSGSSMAPSCRTARASEAAATSSNVPTQPTAGG